MPPEELRYAEKCGGLRVRGIRKQGFPDRPLISVILPVYNGATTLSDAIASVVRQRYGNIELIVIDGASTDGSRDIILANEEHIDLWLSEPDQGVYEAMNKGVERAAGDWLYFLGSDDILMDVIHEVAPHLTDLNGIYYGDVLTSSGRKTFTDFSRRKLVRRNIPHQAMFYPRRVFEKYRYDQKYRVAADYHLNLRCFGDRSLRFFKIPCLVARFDDAAGLSSTSEDRPFAADKPRLVLENLGLSAYLELQVRSGLKWVERSLFRKSFQSFGRLFRGQRHGGNGGENENRP